MEGIKTITNEVKNAVSKSIEPMKNLTNQAKTMASQSASSVSQMKSQLNSYVAGVKSTDKQQQMLIEHIQDLEATLNSADLRADFGKHEILEMEVELEKLRNKLINLQKSSKDVGNESSSAFSKIVGKIKSCVSYILGLNKKTKDSNTSMKKLGTGFAKTFENGIKSVKKFALSLLSVRTAFSMISRAMQSYLSYDTQLADSVQNCWNVLGSLLAPILEYVIGLFSKAVSYVNAFVKALTGVDLVARANAKALNNQAKASKNASKQLSGIDDINNLSSGNNKDDTPTITTEEVDMSKLNPIFAWIDKVKKQLALIFDPFKKAWESRGQSVIDSIVNAFNGLKDLGGSVFGSIMEVWTNGTGQAFVENALTGWSQIFDIVGGIAEALSLAWDSGGTGTAIIQSIADILISIQEFSLSIGESLRNWVLSPEFQEAMQVVVTIFKDLLGYVEQIISWIANMYETYLAPVVDKILNCISKIILAIGSIWNFLKPIIDTIIDVILNVLEPVIDGLCGFIGGIIDAISGIMDFIIGVFTGDWERAWTGIKEFFKGIWDSLVAIFKGAFDTIVAVFKGAWDIIKSVWEVVSTWFYDKIIKPIAGFFSGMWDGVKNGAKNAWEGIKSVFSTVATFFKNIFTNAWTAVKNVFSVGGKIFDGIKDGIVTAFTTIVNGIIKGINKVVALPFNAINKALKKIRDISFLGVSPFTWISLIDVPQIPQLAKGGVMDRETIVKVAEYSNAKSNPEIISPVKIMGDTFRDVLDEYDTSSGTRIDKLMIKVGEETLFDDAIEYINEKTKLKGVSVIKGV